MKRPEDCMDMQDIRAEIDRIDRLIVERIAERAGYVQAAAKFKSNEEFIGLIQGAGAVD